MGEEGRRAWSGAAAGMPLPPPPDPATPPAPLPKGMAFIWSPDLEIVLKGEYPNVWRGAAAGAAGWG